MNIKFIFAILSLFLLVGCDIKSHIETTQNINNSYAKAKSYNIISYTDSFFFYLSNTKEVLHLNLTNSASQKAKNNYPICYFYLKSKQLNSAALNSNIVITYIDNISIEDYLLLSSKLAWTVNFWLLKVVNEISIANKYIEFLTKNNDAEKLHFAYFQLYSLNFNSLREGDLRYITPMPIQPFIEYSIERSFRNVNTKGKIVDIRSINESSKFLECNIIDNGNGFDTNTNKHSQSISIDLISSFIYKATKSKILIMYSETEDIEQSSVDVSFLIPFKLTNHD